MRDAGFRVSVVCPKGPGDPSFHEIEGIRIWKYPPPPPTASHLSFAWEFVYCWARTLVLVLRSAATEGFDVIQACNPPDTYWALAAPFQALRQALRLRPARPLPGGLRVTIRQPFAHPPSYAVTAGTRDVRGRRPRDFDERVLSRDRDLTRRRAAGAGDGCAQRTRSGPVQEGLTGSRLAAG